jgi:RNA 3'-terminal phosphate cyclase (ATP)
VIIIDGSYGEGGGQILRTSLALSLVTGLPFRIEKIRAGREKPGLLRQHLTAVQAARTISDAVIEGAEVGSSTLMFRPGTVRSGTYHFAVGTAGSTTLVFQTVLPALLMQSGSSRLSFEGGTHNPFAPPFDFCVNVFADAMKRMGAGIDCSLVRHGFYPAGGGRFEAVIHPSTLHQIALCERGAVRSIAANAVVAHLSDRIGETEIALVKEAFGSYNVVTDTMVVDSAGPGNIVSIQIRSDFITEQFFGFGEKRVSARDVARKCIGEAQRYLDSPAPVGPHLADQLLIPFALAGGGEFFCSELSSHTKTNIAIIGKFLPVRIETRRIRENNWNFLIHQA